MVLRIGSCRLLNHSYAFQRRFYARRIPSLTPQEVTSILQSNEFTKEFSESGSIKSYDLNQLASNDPIEDTRSEAQCLLTNGLLFGVFDGHGGRECAQSLSKRLFSYIAASLLPPDLLKQYLDTLTKKQDDSTLLRYFHQQFELTPDMQKLHEKSFLKFLQMLESREGREFQMERALEEAFLQFDDDIANEALSSPKELMSRTFSVACSGSVAAVAHIDGPHLHVAGVGDCKAVLGVHCENDGWSAKVLTEEHNVDNQSEVERILSEHPKEEQNTVIKMERLLGQLAPLRSLGDFRYKWSRQIMEDVVVPLYGEAVMPPNYYTPPYLTGKPEIEYHRLSPRDKFLILATDGLWDMMSPLEAVRLVGEHMSGKMTLSPLRLPRKNMKLSEINEMLLHRKEGFKRKPLDANAATHLLRNALGYTEYGIDHGRLSLMLTMSSKTVRAFRDDMTIIVVYTNSEYLRHCPV